MSHSVSLLAFRNSNKQWDLCFAVLRVFIWRVRHAYTARFLVYTPRPEFNFRQVYCTPFLNAMKEKLFSSQIPECLRAKIQFLATFSVIKRVPFFNIWGFEIIKENEGWVSTNGASPGGQVANCEA